MNNKQKCAPCVYSCPTSRVSLFRHYRCSCPHSSCSCSITDAAATPMVAYSRLQHAVVHTYQILYWDMTQKRPCSPSRSKQLDQPTNGRMQGTIKRKSSSYITKHAVLPNITLSMMHWKRHALQICKSQTLVIVCCMTAYIRPKLWLQTSRNKLCIRLYIHLLVSCLFLDCALGTVLCLLSLQQKQKHD